jgi:hypothetical protein
MLFLNNGLTEKAEERYKHSIPAGAGARSGV